MTWLRNPVLLCLMALVVLGAGMRWYHLSSYLAKYPDLTADALEYKDYGDYLVGRSAIEPQADRPPGFPLLLGLLYSVVGQQGKSAALQASLGLVFDSLLILLVWWVGRGMCGPWPALVAALMVALNTELVRCSALAGTEQLYALIALVLLVLVPRLHAPRPWPWLLAFAALGAWLVVVKQEGWLLLVVLVAVHLAALYQGQFRAGLLLLGRAAVLLFPAGASYGWYKYYSSQVLGIPTMDLRTGNALFHAEFLSGRMPWGYMRDLRTEYFQISNSDWLFQFHTPAQIATIIGKSSLMVAQILGEMMGGPVAVLALVVGAVVALREGRLRLAPLLLLAALAPFCLLAEAHSHSSYTPRLLLPALPFAVLCAAVGVGWGMRRLGSLAGSRPWWSAVVPAAVAAGFLGWLFSGETGFGEHPSTFRAAGKAASSPEQPAPSEDLDQLVGQGMRLQIAGDRHGASAIFERVLAQAPAYGPAQMGLALVALGEQDTEGAVNHLETALREVPYFAEAHTLLIAIKLWQHQYAEALEGCRRCVEYRPDYPPCQILLADLLLEYRRDYAGAAAHYETFIALNHQAHLNQLELLQRNMRMNPGDTQLPEVVGWVESYLSTEHRGQTTAVVWHYLNRNKSGAYCGRVKPADGGVYYWLGLAYEGLGKPDKAMAAYERCAAMEGFTGPARQRQEALRQVRGQPLPELGPALYQAQELVDYAISGYFDRQYDLVHGRRENQ